MSDILQKILQQKSKEIASLKKQLSVSDMEQRIKTLPAPKDFHGAILKKHQNHQLALIAEIKKASPSKGIFRKNFVPVQIAKEYEAAGAACLSILTDEQFFHGKNDFLTEVSQVSTLPILRKDFIIDIHQIYEARLIQSDCILLIAACLEKSALEDFTELAHSLQMAVLIEVRHPKELEAALGTKTSLIGINNRDLHTFSVNLETSLTLAREIPAAKTIVSESGIHNADDIKHLYHSGIKTFLIGEAFMQSEDIAQEYQRLFNS